MPPVATHEETARRRVRPGGTVPAEVWRSAIPRDDLVRLLAQGRTKAEIARQYRVHHSLVSRAVQALNQQELYRVVAKLASKAKRHGARLDGADAERAAFEPLDAAGIGLKRMRGLEKLGDHLEDRLKLHTAKPVLAGRAAPGYIKAYLVTCRETYQGLQRLVDIQLKLTDLVSADAYDRAVTRAFGKLEATLGAHGAEAKRLFMAELQEQMALLHGPGHASARRGQP